MPSSSHQLAVILFTDIVGYTALMRENEQKALELIKHYNDSLNPIIGKHHGRVLNNYGDGSLCTFSSVTGTFMAALELQKALQADPAVPLRIGIHTGEIYLEDNKAFGDGVNIASRIQSLGQANTILFSREIYDKIRNHPEFNAVSLGSFDFKNVEEPIEVFALANEGLNVPQKENMKGKLKTAIQTKNQFSKRSIAGFSVLVLLSIAIFFIYNTRKKKKGFTGSERSIAVLPFTNMSSEKENEYFSDGMTEEITTQLSKIGQLKVIARTSTMLYKNSKKSIREIANELGVASILEGSVQKAGNEIRITAQLIDANTQQHIWAEKYDRDFKEVFAIQSEVAQKIAHQLNAKLNKAEKANIEKAPTNNPDAYAFYLQGSQLHNSFWETAKLDYFENSKAMFERALALDSNYALAHAGLADLYNTYTNRVKKDSHLVRLQSVEIEKAWKLDSTSDYLNNVRASVETGVTGDKQKALYYFRKAVEINPNTSQNLWGLAFHLAAEFGLLDESELLFTRAIELDPLMANNFSVRGVCRFFLKDQEGALKDLETALRLRPDFVSAADFLARCYASLGRLEEAKKALEKSLKIGERMSDHYGTDLAYTYAKLNNRQKALELAPNDWTVFLALRMKEEALKAMPFYDEKVKVISTPYLVMKNMNSHSDYDQVRNDPRFLKILELNKKQYEENKRRYSVMDLIENLPDNRKKG